MPDRHVPPRYILILVVLFLMLGAALRFDLLDRMQNMLNYDEAYDAVDALSLLHPPRLVAFFPTNNGRESGWMYLLAPWMAVAGVQPFALRVFAALTGILTLAAVYSLGRRVFDRQTAAWAVGALGVLYWHVHLSHITLRAILFPLTGVLMLAMFLAAHRSNRWRWWLLGGLFGGLTVYTYFSSVLWIGYAAAMLAWWFIRRDDRRGILAAVGVMLFVAGPMILYLINNFKEMTYRPGGVAVVTAQGVLQNLTLWGNAWFVKGSDSPVLNDPGHPLLDIPLGVLVTLGLARIVVRRKQVGSTVWLVGLAIVSILPSLLSDSAPHPLRAIGLVVPIALAAGAGAGLLAEWLRRWTTLAFVLPLLLVGWAAVDTVRTMEQWLRRPDVYVPMEQHISEASTFLASDRSKTAPVYYSPFSPVHPDVGFNESRLAPRHVGAFDSRSCLVLADSTADYVSLDMYDPDFLAKLSRWADVKVVFSDKVTPPHYRVYEATTHPEVIAGEGDGRSAVFDDSVQIRMLNTLPASVRRGGSVTVDLAFRALRPLTQTYSVFLHLYGQPTPYQGGRLWGQADTWICASYPSIYWKPYEAVVQMLKLPVAPDTPDGTYTIAVGIYESDSGVRLPVSHSTEANNYYSLQLIKIAGQ